MAGDLVLWEGPLGVVLGGSHERLMEEVSSSVLQSRTHLAFCMRTSVEVVHQSVIDMTPSEISRCSRCLNTSVTKDVKDLLDWFKYDQVGAACVPKCGSCRCGSCPLVANQ